MLLAWNTHSVFSHTSVCSFHGLGIGDTSHHSGQMKLSERTQSPLAASFVLLLNTRACVTNVRSVVLRPLLTSPLRRVASCSTHLMAHVSIPKSIYFVKQKNVSS